MTWQRRILILNSSLHDKMIGRSTFKAFADNKINVIIKLKCVLELVENIMEGENASFQLFLLFHKCFQMASFLGSFKGQIVW